MQLNGQLKQLGLNHSEILIYLDLLENGLSTPPIVSQRTKITRTNCYNLLAELNNKGLITEQYLGRRKSYVANAPESLVHSLDKKRQIIQSILPDLQGLYTTNANKPKIKYYDGKEQIEELLRLILNAEEILCFLSDYMIFSPHYLQKFARHNVTIRCIISKTLGITAPKEIISILGNLYTVHFLPEEYKNFPTNILIWDDNAALLTLTDPVFGTILTSKILADTFRLMHNVMWKATQ